ncbi:MAG: hypothetical protein KME15_21565 [Drouetiella hepatica Uher 2000/2452]|jgi:hypothetical protein|uniref:Uncharacterized protein n=1 Tax=Drouetiella hepatica Uher 2000/2452 TaxID=904376 RepID=A0A951QEP1_9CYAN|nr:hypothetical protein [Drouetiella hepatica Uher 2000/2452]
MTPSLIHTFASISAASISAAMTVASLLRKFLVGREAPHQKFPHPNRLGDRSLPVRNSTTLGRVSSMLLIF